MKKTLVSTLLIVFLIGSLFVLTGCGEKKEDNKEGQNSVTAKTENNETVTITAKDFYIQNLVPETTIKELYASVAGANTWTPNLLNGLEMASGTQAKIALGITEATSTWDIKVKDEEGTEVVFSSIDLSGILNNTNTAVALQFDENNAPVAVVK